MTESPNAKSLEPQADSAPTAKSAGLWPRLGVAAVVVIALVAISQSGVADVLSLEGLRANQDKLKSLVTEHYVAAALGFMAVYIAATALSVPGAIWLTIAGGFVFGALAATAMVVVAATIGATLIFLLARYVFADLFRAKAGKFAGRMEQGFRNNAFSYMLVLRLVPLFPFFLVNLAPAFLGVSATTFFFGTLVGIIPGTFVFATLGAGIGDALAKGVTVNPGAALMQPTVIGGLLGLAALALVPVVYKRFSKSDG